MKRLLLSILLLTTSVCALAQEASDRHLYWRPGVKLTFEMLDGAVPDTSFTNKLLNRNIGHVIATGLWGVLDVPDSKKGWKKLIEKPYFCAAVDRSMSYWIVKDSTELRNAQLLWDICEVSARIARRNLDHWQKEAEKTSGKGFCNGMISLQYMTCLNDGKQFGDECAHSFIERAIIPRDEEEYKSFRNMIDQLLTELNEYATSEEEIQRFSSGKPAAGYKMAKTLRGDFKNRGEIRY